MAAALSIKLFGAPLVELEGCPLSFPTRKAPALLALLAATPGPHSRSALAAALWPEHDEQHSAGALRYTLAVLKKALGAGPLEISRDRVALAANGASVDISFFQAQVAATRAHGHQSPALCPGCIAALTRAAQLYRDDFLAGFTLRDSPAFDEWQLAQRQRLQHELAWALEQLAIAHSARQEWAPAVEHARRWANLDPLHEPAQRLLMRLFAWSGRRSAALRQFQTCAGLLAAELGVEPAEETRELFEAIKAHRLATPPRSPEPSAPPVPEPEASATSLPPLVARERELGWLGQELALAIGGRGRLRFVVGEAGSGKTALLQSFAHQACQAHPRLIVAAASCKAYTGAGDPLLPFRAILNAFAGGRDGDGTGSIRLPDAGQGREGLAARARAALVAATSEVTAALIGTSPIPAEPGSALDRHALFAQYAAMLHELAALQPLLLILDDLHWADAASLDLLFQLGGALDGSAICIVGAYRPAELAQAAGTGRHPLEALLHAALRAEGEVRVDLDRSAEAAGQAFVDAVIDTMPNCLDADFRRALYAQTAGHPLFTVELLRGLQERGDLVLDDQGRWVRDTALDWSLLPARVEGIIAERIARLDEGLREALLIASVEGELFSAETVAFVQAADEHGVVRALSGELERRHRLVQAVGVFALGASGLARYRFRHALFQQYLYRQLDPVERAQLHGEVGTALERLAGPQAEAFAVELARHFAEAGQTFKAARYLLLAGQRALRLTAGDEAVAHVRRGIALLQAVPPSAERAWHEGQLQIVLGAALSQLHGQSSPETVAAFSQAQQLSVRGGGRRELFVALWGRKSVHDIRAEYQEALAIVDQLDALAEAGDIPTLLPAAAVARGYTLLMLGELEPARLHLERAIAGYDPQLHHGLTLRHGTDLGVVAHTWLGSALWELGLPGQARRQSEAAVALARQLGHRYSEIYALVLGARAFYRGLSVVAARQWTEEAMALMPEGQYAMFHALAMVYHGWTTAALGDPTGGLAELQRGHAALQATGAKMCEPFIHTTLATIYRDQGRRAAALVALDAAQASAERSGAHLDVIESYRLRGELLLLDDATEAEVHLRRATALAATAGARLQELRATVGLARLLGLQGRTTEAVALLEPCYLRFAEGFDAPDLCAARLLLAALAGATLGHTGALQHEVGVRLTDRLPD